MKYSFWSKCFILSLFITLSTSALIHTQATTKDIEKLIASPSLEERQTLANIPQVNIDEFDKDMMAHILKNYGSFEVIGPSIDELSEYAVKALQESRQVLNLPLESLDKVYHENFHGFQNDYKETIEMVKFGKKKQVRSQIAFHIKPYLEPRFPEGIKDIKACENYYAKAESFLYRLYDKIANSFIKPDQKSIFTEGKETSHLTLRKYYPSKKGETGISSHTDFGLLTLIVSDQDGLEIFAGKNENEGNWLSAPFGNLFKPRFYVNVGDWLSLQTGNEEFIAGIHRVPAVEKDRYSLVLFMNPPGVIKLYTRLMTLEGAEVNYDEFLKACRNDFQRNLRKCSKSLLGL